jgi:predicted Zn-dependent protease
MTGRTVAAPLVAALALLLASCSVVDQATHVAADFAATAGVISGSQAEGIKRTSTAFRKSAEEFTESEEYFIGRSVAARILATYHPVADPALNRYVGTLGRVVAAASDRPEIFGGYHFLVLDSDEVNAFAAPGGFVFVTRGLLGKVDSEAGLAAVLAHELGHVSLKHGLKSIRSSRLTKAFSILVVEGGKAYTKAEIGELTEAFEGTLDDIVGTLVVNGYGRGLELDADALAVSTVRRAGYDPRPLASFIASLGSGKGDGRGFYKTHPSTSDRLAKLAKGGVVPVTAFEEPAPRRTRFLDATGRH